MELQNLLKILFSQCEMLINVTVVKSMEMSPLKEKRPRVGHIWVRFKPRIGHIKPRDLAGAIKEERTLRGGKGQIKG